MTDQTALDSGLLVERPAEGVMRLVLNRPEVLNAVSEALREDLLVILRGLIDDPGDVRVLIFTGTGDAFCSGGDVREFGGFLGPTPPDGYHAQERFQEMAMLFLKVPQPVITAVNGQARGGGTAISMMSDLRIASDNATFAVGQVKRGLVPDVGLTYLLPRVVGLGRAMELMFSNEVIDAAEAFRIGMVNRVVPRDELEDEAVEMASALATSSRTSLEWIKRITYMNLDLTMEQAFRQESLIQSMLAQTGDFQEALEAFKQKRDPNPA
jgi:enoyl-CoA hydratase/carnithine racemase